MFLNLPVYWPAGILVDEFKPSQVLILELLILKVPPFAVVDEIIPFLVAVADVSVPTDKCNCFGEMKVKLDVPSSTITPPSLALTWLMSITVPALKTIDWFLLNLIAPAPVVSGESNLKFWPNTKEASLYAVAVGAWIKAGKPFWVHETSSPTRTLLSSCDNAGSFEATPLRVTAVLEERSPITNWLPSPIVPAAANLLNANSALWASFPSLEVPDPFGSSGSSEPSPGTAPSVLSIIIELSLAIKILPAPRTISLAIIKTLFPENVTLEPVAMIPRIA